ncbi:MAG: UDP-N-acetylmuramoyl-tripeptide--D-alanyl-D-alanine ligase, partial [Ignavibacteria bacterium]|nr:UDP-N-acetylmuramoyl-tripeptide--D-alanyl-D-alanine ligase [Ignavibacteria bacterium]
MIRINDLFKIKFRNEINTESVRNKNAAGAGIDSRTIKKDEIFFAIKGDNTDGHLYL